MADGREPMTELGVGAPGPGGQGAWRRGPRGRGRRATSGSGSEVVARSTRRGFAAEYTHGILEETDRSSGPGAVGRILPREGLYSSHLTGLAQGQARGLTRGPEAVAAGPKPARRSPLRTRMDELQAQVVRLEKQLATAETILEVQGSAAGMLGLSFDSGRNS